MGLLKSCVRWHNTRVGLRCSKYKEGLRHPECPTKANSPRAGLKGGGRSQNYTRGKRSCSEVASATSRRKRAKRKSGKSSKRARR